MSSSTKEQYNMPSTSADTIQINKAVQRISFLEGEVHRLTDQLWLKDSSHGRNFGAINSAGSQTLSRLSVSALQDMSQDDTIPLG